MGKSIHVFFLLFHGIPDVGIFLFPMLCLDERI